MSIMAPAVSRTWRGTLIAVSGLVSARSAALALAVVAAAASPARADRWFLDVEPVAIHAAGDDRMLSSMFVLSVGRAHGTGRATPYVALGAGFINLQARAGALVRLGGVRSPWVARVELRPQLSILCGETAVFGGAGLGYRFAGDGTPITVLAAAEAGPGWTRRDCGPDRMPGPTEQAWFGGGTLSLAFGL